MPPSFGYHENSSFSPLSPMFQLAWDSTSLGEFKTCPRKYYYSIVLGWEPLETSVHLIFGLLMHSAAEHYDHFRASGVSHEDAMWRTLAWAMAATWNKALGRPWMSVDSNKNRLTLIRTIVWHMDKYGENDPLQTVILSDGRPAVELSFHFANGYASQDGEPLLTCGHMDRIAKLNSESYIVDKKSTKNTISASFFAQYSPDNQFSTYMLAGRVAFQLPVKGLIVDAAQVAVGFTRFERGLVERTEGQINEWVDGLGFWFASAESCAKRGWELESASGDSSIAWPMNDKNCSMYGGCSFRKICSKAPGQRQQWLRTEFRQRQWNPLSKRGDI